MRSTRKRVGNSSIGTPSCAYEGLDRARALAKQGKHPGLARWQHAHSTMDKGREDSIRGRLREPQRLWATQGELRSRAGTGKVSRHNAARLRVI